MDWSGYDQYFQRLTAGRIAVNLGTLVPATLVRSEVIGLDNRAPTPEELGRMTAMVEQAMQDGAFGLSSALIYMPGSFASTEELVALAKAAGRHRGIYVSHIRGESFNLFNALDEALRIGRDGELPVVVFHLKVGASANWGRMGEAVAKLSTPRPADRRSRRRCIPMPPAARAWRRCCRCGPRKAATTRCWRGWPIRRNARACARRSRARPRAGRTC